MSTFGSILSQGRHLIEVGPATLRGPGLAFSITKASVRALLRFEQANYSAGLVVVESGRITIDYSTHAEPKSAHWIRLATLDASELQAYGKNTLGFDTVRMVFDEDDRAAIAVWLDGVMERATPEEMKYFIEVGWPSYGSRDEILGTNWHREPKAYASEAEARRAVSKHPDLMNDDSDIRVVTSAGEVKHHRHIVIHEPSDALFGLSVLSNFLNSHRKYHLTGDVWKGKSLLQSQRRLTLGRFDASRDSAFFLYLYEGGLIGRVGPTTVAASNKWVSFKKGKYAVRVLRTDLLKALEALA